VLGVVLEVKKKSKKKFCFVSSIGLKSKSTPTTPTNPTAQNEGAFGANGIK